MERIEPIVVDGMPVMSMGFMVRPDQAVIWRGPMLHKALTQFLQQTEELVAQLRFGNPQREAAGIDRFHEGLGAEKVQVHIAVGRQLFPIGKGI